MTIILENVKKNCAMFHRYIYTLRGAFKGGQEWAFGPPLEELLPSLRSNFHIFSQSYYEMIKGVQHVHVL